MKKNYILFILILIKTCISLPFIISNPIDLDEPFSIFNAQLDLNELFQLFKHENNPPLHFFILHFWEKLFGISPVAARSLSLLFSLLTIPILFNIGKNFISKKAGIFACILFIFSDFHQYFGLEARTYSLLVLEFSTLIYFLLRTFHNPTLINYIFLGLINTLLFYTHYISITIFVSEFLLLTLFIRSINIRFISISILIFSLLISPVIVIFINRFNDYSSTISWVKTAEYSELYGLLNKFLNDKWVFLFLGLSIFFLLLFNSKYIQLTLKEYKAKISILFILTFIPFLLSFFLSKSGIASIFLDRYLFFITIPIYFLIALLFEKNNTYAYSAQFLFIALVILRFDIRPNNDRNGNELAEFIKKQHVETIVIAPHYYDLTFLYHYNQNYFKNTTIRKLENSLGIYPINDGNDIKKINLKGKIAVIDADFNFTTQEKIPQDWFKEKNLKILKVNYFKTNYKVTILK
jgi:uncharacterized membrane protein